MNNSIDSSSPEPTVSGLKSIFNKPTNISQGFEVSIAESVTAVPNNGSELDLDTTTVGNKVLPFKNSEKTTQDFNVTSDDSALNSESEKSVTFSKPQPVFSKKRKSLIDFFNVSYNDTNGSLLADDTGRSVESVFNKNPFNKKNDSHNELSVTSTEEVEEETNITVNEATMQETETEVNEFQRPEPFKRKKSLQSNNSISVTEERSDISTAENILADPDLTPRNISIDRSIPKQTNTSASYMEQSSINDENLNNWMSDHSDEEMPAPRISSVSANLSHTKEKPPAPASPVTETNQQSIWEQKFSEIMSNAERKSKVIKGKIVSPQKPKPFKKSDLNIEKPIVNVNKYKPPKLIKPASFATKKLYEYVIKRLKPKYGIDTMLESENLVMLICDTVKKVTRRKTHQKKMIQNLKKEMAEAGLIETTMDFYEFVIKFLPYDFRVKVVPCIQPVTNIVYPPKEGLNPFEKIL